MCTGGKKLLVYIYTTFALVLEFAQSHLGDVILDKWFLAISIVCWKVLKSQLELWRGHFTTFRKLSTANRFHLCFASSLPISPEAKPCINGLLKAVPQARITSGLTFAIVSEVLQLWGYRYSSYFRRTTFGQLFLEVIHSTMLTECDDLCFIAQSSE